MLNFRLYRRAYFSLRNDSLRAKIGVKMDEISQKYRNPNKVFTVFFMKTDNFDPALHDKLYRLGKNWNKQAGPS